MDNIKFRGKTKEGKWVEGYHYCACSGIKYILSGRNLPVPISNKYIDILRAFYIEVIPETVGMFTGLHDKNGKEVYHHDLIIHEVRNGGKPIEIIWKNGSWRGRYLLSSDNEFSFILDDKEMAMAKVIGNIHDNPE